MFDYSTSEFDIWHSKHALLHKAFDKIRCPLDAPAASKMICTCLVDNVHCAIRSVSQMFHLATTKWAKWSPGKLMVFCHVFELWTCFSWRIIPSREFLLWYTSPLSEVGPLFAIGLSFCICQFGPSRELSWWKLICCLLNAIAAITHEKIK